MLGKLFFLLSLELFLFFICFVLIALKIFLLHTNIWADRLSFLEKKLFTLLTWKGFLKMNFLVSQKIGVMTEGLATNFTCEIIMLMWWFHMNTQWPFVAELCRTLYARNLEHQFLHNQETHSKYSTNLFLIWTAVVVELLHLGESFSTLLTQGYRSFHGVVKLVRF